LVKILDGRTLAKEIRAEVAVGVAELLQKHQVNPGLAAVLVGDDPASAIYVRNKRRACDEVGMFSETFTMPYMATQAALVEKLEELNADHRFHGILVQLPLPTHFDENAVIEALLPHKDVDGLHPYNVGKLTQAVLITSPVRPQASSSCWCATDTTPREKTSSSAAAAISWASPWPTY